jgi:hypothetical protein
MEPGPIAPRYCWPAPEHKEPRSRGDKEVTRELQARERARLPGTRRGSGTSLDTPVRHPWASEDSTTTNDGAVSTNGCRATHR